MRTAEINRKFRDQVQERRAILVPGASNALAARVIADSGFEAAYVSGAGITNSFFGLPDLGFVGLTDLAQHTMAIRDSVELPIIVDADTGFGNALNVYQTVRVLERAGASAIQIEDQVSPKRCGHFDGKEVVEAAEMRSKIRAAVDARTDPNLLVVARTDARAGLGLQAALDRAHLYAENGADVLFVEAPESVDEIDAIADAINAPLLINLVLGGKTPVLPQGDLARRGYALVLYANAALQAAIAGMQKVLRALRAEGVLETGPEIAGFEDRQRLVRKPWFDTVGEMLQR